MKSCISLLPTAYFLFHFLFKGSYVKLNYESILSFFVNSNLNLKLWSFHFVEICWFPDLYKKTKLQLGSRPTSICRNPNYCVNITTSWVWWKRSDLKCFDSSWKQKSTKIRQIVLLWLLEHCLFRRLVQVAVTLFRNVELIRDWWCANWGASERWRGPLYVERELWRRGRKRWNDQNKDGAPGWFRECDRGRWERWVRLSRPSALLNVSTACLQELVTLITLPLHDLKPRGRMTVYQDFATHANSLSSFFVFRSDSLSRLECHEWSAAAPISAYLRRWATRLFWQWMLHWWQVSGSAARYPWNLALIAVQDRM